MNYPMPVLASALVGVAAFLATSPAAAQERQPAAWSSHELDFQYMGFTSRYTCSGLQDAVKDILLRLGARDDRDMVLPGACSDFGDRPSRIAGVRIKVASLQPVDAGAAGAVDAYWKPVTVGGASSGADCELIEQVKKELLPLFATRRLQPLNVSCIPNQPSTVPPRLTLEVLSPAPPAR
jgi:hypothetical protein